MDKKHLNVAKSNEKLLEEVDISKFIDWKYTVLYYAALHYGDSLSAKKGHKGLDDHGKRRSAYKKVMNNQMYNSYKRLEERSRVARYNPDFRKLLSEAEYTQLYNDDFIPIKTFVCSLVK